MPGLLDLVDDPNQLGLLSLGLRLMSTPGKFGAALGQAGMGALGDVQQARSALEARKLREQQMRFQQLQEERAAQLFPLQLAQVTAQTEETKAQAAQRLALAEEAARKQREVEAIRKLLVSQLTPTQGIEANAVSGITGPRPEALAVVGAPRKIDAQALVAQGVPVETVKALMESPNFGRAKVARTVEVDDGQGGKQTVQLDDYGNRVGVGMPGYIAPVQVNQGDRVTFARPQAGVSLPVGMSPDAKASNALGYARLGFDKDQANKGVTYQQDTNGNFVALPNKAEPGSMVRAAPVLAPGGGMQPLQGASGAKPTEDQAKAAGWLVQASNAHKNMLAAIDPKGGTPSASKPGLPDFVAGVPSFGLGEGVANMMRGTDRMKFLQAASSLSEALLRAATGAGVNRDEAAQKVKELTPVVGDNDATIKQKMEAIPLYLKALEVRAGPAAKQVQSILPSGNVNQPKFLGFE